MEATRIPIPETLSLATTSALLEALARAGSDSSRVVIIEGRPEVFCRGLDLASVSDRPRAAHSIAVSFARCLEAIRALAKPTIALVRGEALGGGVGLAAACDLVIATGEASFALPEALFGLLPAIVLPVLLERMPAQKARLLALSAQGIGAARAREIGLVDEVVAAAGIESALRPWVRALARPRPGAVAALKRTTAEEEGLTLDDALGRAAVASASAGGDPAVVAAIREFLASGVAPWL
ncbi:MAG TPA: enoyl-CoA hydratase/isomerase family protein, partial [Planctomycetota bacterium]|nr:enoyl-CoA hydratase/isomerase family protein [Planctomycetota bacterium]